MAAGQPSGMVRLMSFKDSASLRRALLLICAYYIVVYVGLLIIFVCARAIYPEQFLREVGSEGEPDSIMPAMARRLAHPTLEDFIQLDDEHGILQVRAPAAFQDRRLADLKLRAEYQVNLILIRRQIPSDDEKGSPTERTIAVPTPDEVIRAGDTLVLVGTQHSLAKLPPE